MKQFNPELAKQLVAPVLALCLAICLFCLGYQCSRKPEPIESEKTVTVTKTDTLLQWRTKEVKVPHPVPVTKTITRVERDTFPVTQVIHSRDTVFATVDVPISTQKYSDEQVLQDSTRVSYVANLSGYRASLDSLEFKVTYPERTINTATTTVTTSTKKKHWGIGPAVGLGWGLTSKRFDVYAGLSISYTF